MPVKETEKAFDTREGWLMASIEHMRPWFEELGRKLPDHIRVSTGWSKGSRKGTIGWTWMSRAAGDQINNVFINPEIDDNIVVLATLLHELVHVVDDCKHGHGAEFRALAVPLGLTGKMTATSAGEALVPKLEAIVTALGAYPHSKMLTGALDRSTAPKKQTTRMIKVECECCGYVVRTTQKWLDMGNPQCPAGTEMMPEG